MEQESVFGLHTAQFKKWISKTEANSIKAFFNLNPDEELAGSTYFYQDGVTRFWIEEIKGKKPRYYLHIVVNFARALKMSNYRIMPYTTGNARKVFTVIDKLLKVLPLSNNNAVFQDWTVVRFDSAFDIHEEHAELLMLLLNRSVNLSDRKKRCSRIAIQGKTPQESECQSMRFGNKSFTYNIYRKIEEIQDKGKSITEEEKAEIQYLLRVERQNHENACKKLLPNMKASDLLISKVHDDILKTMIDEMKIFFNRGDFYSWKRIIEKYYPEHESDICEIKDVMTQITLHSLETAQEIYTKEIRTIFDKLGLSPVGIKKEVVEQYGIDFMQGIYSRIIAAYPRPPDRRQYNSFPIPHQTGDGRFKAAITLYNADSGRKRVQVAGKTLADYENKVFSKLVSTYIANQTYLESNNSAQKDLALKSADSIVRFCKVAKTTAVKQGTAKFIKNLKLDSTTENSTGDSPNPSATGGGLTISDNPNNI